MAEDLESPAPEGVDLCGLAKAWGDDARVREPLLKSGSLFVWPCKKTTGIASFASLALNHAAIHHLLDFWCCQTPTAKSIYIEHAKAEIEKLRDDLGMAPNAVRVQCDPRTRALFDKALQFWEPTFSKRKRTKSEREQDEDDEAAVPSEDFHPEDDSQEQAECDRATVDAYMNVLSRRSPEMAQRESLLHAAETSRSDDAFMAKALGSDTMLSTPTANLTTGLTAMLEELELSTEKPPVTDPLASTSEPKPKADGPVVIELGDSPPEPPKKAPRLHADFSRGLPTGAAARLQMLKREIERRQATRLCARPLRGQALSMDAVDTCQTDMSPIAQNLMKRFDQADAVDLSSPVASASRSTTTSP
ncbi:unnamed protein product, partial [Symbiodinium necroappetens]